MQFEVLKTRKMLSPRIYRVTRKNVHPSNKKFARFPKSNNLITQGDKRIFCFKRVQFSDILYPTQNFKRSKNYQKTHLVQNFSIFYAGSFSRFSISNKINSKISSNSSLSNKVNSRICVLQNPDLFLRYNFPAHSYH
jgi:hypothetical protein